MGSVFCMLLPFLVVKCVLPSGSYMFSVFLLSILSLAYVLWLMWNPISVINEGFKEDSSFYLMQPASVF